MASVAIAQGTSKPSSSSVNPTSVTHDYWVWAEAPHAITSSQDTLGKWLVFKALNKLDETWHTIRKAEESGELGSTGAKCSTAREKPTRCSRDGVICVYTSEETVDEVGLKLIYIVKHDIRYKTDEATLQGVYASKGHKNVALKTIYWNDGEPSFVRKSVKKQHGKAKHDSKDEEPSRPGISKAKAKEYYSKVL